MNNTMKKIITLSLIGLFSAISFPALAENPKGQRLAEKTLEGFGFSYILLDLEERNELMKGMEGMKMHGMSDSPDVTHHLVVYVTKANGKPASGKIGFSITHPDGTVFKTLTMGMNDGYGADVMFTAPGNYNIQMKAVISGKTVNDEFIYEVKKI